VNRHNATDQNIETFWLVEFSYEVTFNLGKIVFWYCCKLLVSLTSVKFVLLFDLNRCSSNYKISLSV